MAKEDVGVAVGGGTVVAVKVAGTVVAVADGAGVTGVTVGGVVVGEIGVVVDAGLGVSAVVVPRGMEEEMGVGEGVIKIGEPSSLQPRSGAPIKPVIGEGGTASPLFAINWAIPLSIAGEPDWMTSPLKSSSTVSHVPSGPGLGAA